MSMDDIAAVVREANRIATEGGTEEERADHEDRKQAVLDQLEDTTTTEGEQS